MNRWLVLFLAGSLSAQQIQFERVVKAIDFRLENFPTSEKYLPETMAGGIALFDYDNDGRVDIFFANGAALDGSKKAANRLYRNEGAFRFRDVTRESGLSGHGFAFGGAAADFDGDGYVDLYVPALPKGQLFHNRGNGTFEDWTAKLPPGIAPWTVAAGWFDYDRDGRPDLFLVNYLDWSIAKNPWCGDRGRGLRVYCHPRQFASQPNQLLRNLGGGRFADVSEASGVSAAKGKGMSVVFGDANGDGWLDAFVTNDTEPSFLFVNQRNGKFVESGLNAGVSLPDAGNGISAMGAIFQDFDNDGREDIAVSALARETFPLYRNEGSGNFREVTNVTKLASASARFSGWGIALEDFDNDGWKDLVTANSHVNDEIEKTSSERYRQTNAIFRNQGGKSFAVSAFGEEAAHRGLAVVDLDGDGRLDLVVTVLGGAPEIWRNVSPDAGNWIEVDAPLGTVVRVGAQMSRSGSSVGYSSSARVPLHFGLGRLSEVRLEITWPDGKTEVREKVRAGTRVKIAR